ncbi:MAG: tetratricopeptide repeat protein [Bacteroidales bacterium]|nr:tetratricopeptide repeat protein [Bacteroidales bacterium]
MRKLIYLLMIVVLLASCTGNRDKGSQNQEGQLPIGVQDTELEMSKEGHSGDLYSPDSTGPQFQSEESFSEVDLADYNRYHGTAEFHYKRGLVLYRIKNFKEGILEFDTVINLAPQMTSAYINRGKGRLEIKDYQNAVLDFEKATEIDKMDSTAYLHLGLAHYHLNNMQSCIEANNELLKLSPKNIAGYFNRGTAYGQLKDYPKAIADFSKAIQIDPNYTEAHFNLGLAYYWTGDKVKACQSWSKAASLRSEKAARVLEKYCR